MSDAINAPMAYWSSNSLSPEPCALIPNPLRLRFSSIVKAVVARVREGIERDHGSRHAHPTPRRMDGPQAAGFDGGF